VCNVQGILKSDSGPFSQSLSNMAESELTDVTVEKNNTVSVYPNPAHSSIIASGVQNAQISILDLLGKVVVAPQVMTNQNPVKIEIETIPMGMYIVKIVTSDSVHTSQFVKE